MFLFKADFGNRTHIHAIATQGSSKLAQYVTSYKVKYDEDGSDVWKDYKEGGEVKVSDLLLREVLIIV